ncbi:MAG: hypothetical protein HYZ28_07310 [Myxococcales bacterium]|nr:hypothetical protein [Myxococcales bacterium]
MGVCGDPNRDLVVEIVANTRTGHHAQDFEVAVLTPDASVFTLADPMSVGGEIQRYTIPECSSATCSVAYTSGVTVRAVGESELIPGLTRRYEYAFTSLDRGAYSLFVGAGKYTVTAAAQDLAVPPAMKDSVAIAPGAKSNVSLVFPAQDGTLQLAGRLLKRYVPGTPPTETPVFQAEMDLQAFDSTTKRPLSQRVPASSGNAGSTGDFTIAVDPAALKAESFILVASPKDPFAPVPSKTFIISKPYQPTVTLELGDFGELVPVTGQILAADGVFKIAKATVVVEGTVRGGGSYRSRPAITDADGTFLLDALLPDSAFTLTVTPTSPGPNGIFRGQVRILATRNKDGTYPIDPLQVRCPDRVKIIGTLLRPGSERRVAANVPFSAVPIEPIDGRPLPWQGVDSVTDEDGAISLSLDPAVYRFDFLPGEDLPRRSRIVRVKAVPTSDGKGIEPIDLGEHSLYNGRLVTGTVKLEQSTITTGSVAAAASVRFFRVSTVEGKPSPLLLGQAVTDERGRYSVLLPAAE